MGFSESFQAAPAKLARGRHRFLRGMTMAKPISLILADEHTLFRAGMRLLLSLHDDLQVIGETGDGAEAIRLCLELEPDVLLLGLRLGEMDGFEVASGVAEARIGTRILALSMYENEEYAARILHAGGKGFALKTISPADLVTGIRKVAYGEAFISPSLMEKTFMRIHQGKFESPLIALSNREYQVFVLLVNGVNLKAIAHELCLSGSSVRTYKQRIMEKLEVSDLSELIRLALRYKILEKL